MEHDLGHAFFAARLPVVRAHRVAVVFISGRELLLAGEQAGQGGQSGLFKARCEAFAGIEFKRQSPGQLPALHQLCQRDYR